MLKLKQPAVEIMAIKLVTGEEIIACVKPVDGNTLEIMRPLTLVMTLPRPGEDQGQVAFAPWMLGLDSDHALRLPLTSIIYFGKAREDAAQEYISATGLDASKFTNQA
jgi:hypothetical protein